MLFTQFLIILIIAGELCYFSQVQARLAHNMRYVIDDVIRSTKIPHLKIFINRYFIRGICLVKVCTVHLRTQARCSYYDFIEPYITVYSRKYVNQINNKTVFYRSQKAAISLLFSKPEMA